MTTKGAITVLYDFQAGTDGESPGTPLIFDAAGNLYGTTISGGGTGCGGEGCGTVFRLAPDGTEAVLHAFAGGGDGSGPESGLIFDSAGNLYGATAAGGGGSCQGGCGTVFEITTDGVEKIVSAFNTAGGPKSPRGAIIRGKNGKIFGTTDGGGDAGCGTVFETSPRQEAKAIYSFSCGANGASPQAGLIRAANGVFYGTTELGGDSRDGTVFAIQK